MNFRFFPFAIVLAFSVGMGIVHAAEKLPDPLAAVVIAHEKALVSATGESATHCQQDEDATLCTFAAINQHGAKGIATVTWVENGRYVVAFLRDMSKWNNRLPERFTRLGTVRTEGLILTTWVYPSGRIAIVDKKGDEIMQDQSFVPLHDPQKLHTLVRAIKDGDYEAVMKGIRTERVKSFN
ncbi:MAG: hypothetical protein COY40_06760 [Alphaproteobacteria bacterium CG_4_10_14_0_8_um_filter_53_9]|nr:MAG: hypothetical protein COY40_06760 [Alphaproteobacteria bacterium CG_4_10_14_0_8_um_filter_53_9]